MLNRRRGINGRRPAPSKDEEPGVELARTLAGYPIIAAHVGTSTVNSRVVQVMRDANGNVTGSIERIEHTEHNDIEADWAK